ncbi:MULTISPECIES: MSHA biogenesis protein MshJ [Shewanella]|uniref:MSHA biogenesis protein MshJ n=1 Tax=Shewanella psychromarinicola TaxID=2487742 RepID=A0A3N4DQE4_9GAMM|nr:MSHA biogenesis protein MshJ [Shewanella psychromarinicola]AZG34553.1 MSHA biogenesis protein MshJ [Shewanella psychromarinicola]MCL1081698.1 MSHA biogenesis protein MshJ [Shewanella psychromarinicola]RPA28129.1 MSHA biogenesis protein MshJ [Shewanella psychromarinicola]
MKQQWLVWSSKFDALSPRERILITFALLVLAGMLLFMPLESQWKQHQSLQNQLKGLEQENSISLQQVALYEERLQLDPNKDYQQRLQIITEQMQLIDADLTDQMVDMVPADYMPTVLANLLGNVKGVTLISFASIAPKALLQVGDGSKVNLYSHGIKLMLQGDYFSILAFIKAVETMPDKLYWKRLDYRVESHPEALVELELYTLSVNKDFISVAKQD